MFTDPLWIIELNSKNKEQRRIHSFALRSKIIIQYKIFHYFLIVCVKMVVYWKSIIQKSKSFDELIISPNASLYLSIFTV